MLLAYGDDPRDAAALRRTVEQLAVSSEPHDVRIDELPGFEPVDGCSLTASARSVDSGVEQLAGSYRAFRCVLRPAAWMLVFWSSRTLREERGGPVHGSNGCRKRVRSSGSIRPCAVGESGFAPLEGAGALPCGFSRFLVFERVGAHLLESSSSAGFLAVYVFGTCGAYRGGSQSQRQSTASLSGNRRVGRGDGGRRRIPAQTSMAFH